MRSRNFIIALSLVLATSVAGAQQETILHDSVASVPLEEILRLYRERDEALEPPPDPPPIPATVDSIELSGLLLDRVADVSATIQVTVLVDARWVTVPLIRKNTGLDLSDLPDVEGAVLTVIDGDLALVARTPGTYQFTVNLTTKARVEGSKRTATIELARSTSSLFRLTYDSSSFRLRSRVRRDAADAALLIPDENRFILEWDLLEVAPSRRASDREQAPPAEPVIVRAHASVVSTLEGQRVIRVLYALKVQGTHRLRCAVPQGHTLTRVYRNGSALPFASTDGVVELDAEPARAGGDSGTVELLLVESPGAYHLAGKLAFTMPTASWPIHELFVSVHLPEVFNYTWSAGNLERTGSAPEAAFTHHLPTPGKTLEFHQYLVTDSQPRLTLAYTIDLEGKYYRP